MWVLGFWMAENSRQGTLRFLGQRQPSTEVERPGSLTGQEMESDNRSIRNPVIVNWFSRPNELVTQ